MIHATTKLTSSIVQDAPRLAKTSGSIRVRRHHSSVLVLVVIAVAVAIAILLRWSGLGTQSLWLDEGYTFWISRFSPRDLQQVLSVEPNPPLYYVLIHYWCEAFGASEFSLRALSAVFGSLSVPLFYLLSRKVLEGGTSIAFAMIAEAVSFFQVWYAREARSYAMLSFLCLASVYCLVLYLEKRTAFRFCTFVLCVTATLYTHNMAFFYLPGLAICWFVYPAKRTLTARMADGMLAVVSVSLLYLPWLPTLRSQIQTVHGSFSSATPKVQDLIDTFCVISGFDEQTFQAAFRAPFHSTRLFGFWTWAPAILLMDAACILGGVLGVRPGDGRKVAALAVHALAPLFLVFAYSHLSSPIYFNRVFIASCAILPIVLFAAIAFQTGKCRRVFQVLGIAVVVWTAVSAAGHLRRETREDWRGLTEYLSKLPEQHRLVVVIPDLGQPLVRYYENRLSKSGPLQMTGLLTNFNPPDVGLQTRTIHQFDPNTDKLGLLSGEMASGKYKELDVAIALGPAAPLVKPVLEYLAVNCAAIQDVEFHWLEVRRCFVRSRR